jgi:muramidase (phage lysozyme)
MPAFAALGPALKMLASQGLKKAATETAKGVVKDKAKNFVTGKGRRKKGRGGALVKSEGGQITQEGEQGKGGALVPVTPMVGNYRVETPPQKPDEEGKPPKVSYETINNQLDSIVGLTEALKKTSMAKMKTATNRRKAERKSEEKTKQRNRESLLEKGAVGAIGAVGGAVSKAAPFDPIKFFTMIFLGSLVTWIMTHGSKITAFLKMTLALMNNFGKLVKAGFTALKNVFKVGFNTIKKLGGPLVKVGKFLKTGLKSLGNKLFTALGRIGNGLKNLAKGVFNKIKAAGKILTAPIDGLKGLTGAEKKAVKTNKGLNKLLQQGGTGSQNLGTATRKPGTLSSATRSMRMRHGDEAARMYQGLVDNGMKPSRAAQYVNKSIQSGKLTSAPLEGNLAGGKKGSQLFKGGIGRSTNRMIAKFGGKNALRATKALKKALGRIPIVGSLITLVVSLISGEPLGQAMFKAGGAALGGFLGSFIPIPVVGTLFGEIVGEYVGDLMYVATMGGGVDAVGQKLKDDLTAALSMGQKAMDWVGNGFGRMYEGIPKINIPWPINKKFPDVGWMLSLGNIPEKLGVFHKAFFTDDPMEKGKETTEETSNNVTNVSTVRRDTAGARAGDFIMASDGTLGVFDGMGTRGLRAGEQELFDSGATNVDGTKPSSTSVPTTSNASYWGPLLETIAKKESVGGSYDSIYPGTTKQKRYGGKALTEMTISEADAWQASTAGERGSAAAGRYQFMYILNQAKAAGLKGTDMFSAENQDKMAISLIVDKRKITPDMIKNNPNEAMIRLGMEWAAFPMPVDMQGHSQHVKAGQSYYAGDGRNASGATVAEMRAAFAKLGAPPETYTTAGVTYDLASGLPVSGHESETPRQPTPDNSDKMSDQNQTDSVATPTPTPAQITPPSQSSLASGISGISRQLPYEEVGGTTILMAPGSSRGGAMVGRTSAGTPVIVGSGDVVNSYYKSQLLGFLYKQG